MVIHPTRAEVLPSTIWDFNPSKLRVDQNYVLGILDPPKKHLRFLVLNHPNCLGRQ
jgi:hypothetical protein